MKGQMFTGPSEKQVDLGRFPTPACRTPMTAKEEEVYRLLTKETLWPAEIARRLKKTKQSIQRHVRNLRRKGYINGVDYTPVDHTCTPSGSGKQDASLPVETHPVRLHAEQWSIRVLQGSEAYAKARLRSTSVLEDGNRVALYRDSIVVFSYQSFLGVDPDACDRAASAYWVRFFLRLESRFKFVILKERSQNVKRVKAHYAEMGNELADELRRKKQALRVFGSQDGKEWLLFDDSHALNEAETTHTENAREPKTAAEDMAGVVQPFFNDLRDNREKIALPSQTQEMINALAKNVSTVVDTLQVTSLVLNETAQHQRTLSENWRTHVGLMQSLKELLDRVNRGAK